MMKDNPENLEKKNDRSFIKEILLEKDLSNGKTKVNFIKYLKSSNNQQKIKEHQKKKKKTIQENESEDEDDLNNSSDSDTVSKNQSTSDNASSFSNKNSIVDKSSNTLIMEGYLSNILQESKQLKTNFEDINTNINTDKINYKYPLEINEIFPDIKKFDINKKSTKTETPIYFIQNLIYKNYNKSVLFNDKSFYLKNFRNSADYQYKIMSQEDIEAKEPLNKVTCILIGPYYDYNINKNNNTNNNINNKNNLNKNFLFLGYENGIIRIYILLDKIKNKKDKQLSLIKTLDFGNKVDESTIKDLDKHVLCMNFSQEYLLVGYATGYIILWRISDMGENGKIIYIINDVFDMPIIACDLLSISPNKKEFLFLASDLVGKVRLIHYTKNPFLDSHTIKVVSNCSFPCFLLSHLHFNENEEREYGISKLNQRINIKSKSHICYIGSIEYVELVMINKSNEKIKSILIIQNPDYKILKSLNDKIRANTINESSAALSMSLGRRKKSISINLLERLNVIEIPDTAFGLGYIGDLNKNFNNYIYLSQDEPYVLFVISWQKKITLYYFSQELSYIREIGYYFNNYSIIKIGFINLSLIYFIDTNNNIKLLNTKYFNPILSLSANSALSYTNLIYNNKFLIPLSDIILLEKPIKSITKHFTDTTSYYNAFVHNNIQNLFLIGENNCLKQIRLLSYDEFLDTVINNGNWRLFFSVFIDILKTKKVNFGKIPENDIAKKKLLFTDKNNNKLIQADYINKFFQFLTEKKDLKSFINSNNNHYIGEDDCDFDFDDEAFNYDYLSMGIEFCIEIGSIDYINNELIKQKNNEELIKYFLNKLEPFILSNKFRKNHNLLSDKIINEIINYYCSTTKITDYEKKYKLDLLICHLSFENFRKNKNIVDIVKKYNLFCSMMFLFSNGFDKGESERGEGGGIIYALEFIFEEFKRRKNREIKNEEGGKGNKISSATIKGYYNEYYNDFVKDLKMGKFNYDNNLFLSKEYLGHLLMFFVILFAKGLSFPTIEKCDEKIYKDYLGDLFLFFTKKEIASNLIEFDSFSFFEILATFFINDDNENENTQSNNMNIDNSTSSINIIDRKNNIEKKNEINNNNNEIYNILIKNINEEKLRQNILEYNKDKDNKDDNEIDDNKSIENLVIKLLMKIIIMCEQENDDLKTNIFTKLDLYIFITKISNKIISIPPFIINKSLLFIFNFHSEINSLRQKSITNNSINSNTNNTNNNINSNNNFDSFIENLDKFQCHINFINKNIIYLDELSHIINKTITNYYIFSKNNINNKEKNSNNNNKTQIDCLLKDGLASPFLDVKIFLLEKSKEYIQCINVYLSETNKTSAKKVFKFISETLTLFQSTKDDYNMQNFKNEIKKNIPNLTSISFAELFSILNKWFNTADKDIILSLNTNHKLQLKYLEKIKSSYKKKIKNTELNDDDYSNSNSNLDSIRKEFSDILLLYIKILLKMHKNSKVMKTIREEKEFIDIAECLKICNNKSYDACIYLYEMEGDERRALYTSMKQIQKSYEDINNNIDNSSYEYIYFTNLFTKIKKNFEDSIKICEKNSASIILSRKFSLNNLSSNDINSNNCDKGEDLWFEFFENMYNLLVDKPKKKHPIFNEIKSYLSEKIESFLIIMSFYVDFNFIFKNKFNELKFPLLKNFLSKMFYTKTRIANIYNSNINLLSSVVKKDMKIIQRKNQMGMDINLTAKNEDIINRKLNLFYPTKKNSSINKREDDIDKEVSNSNKEKENDEPKIYKKCQKCLQMLNYIDDNDVNNYTYNKGVNLVIFRCGHIFHYECLDKEFKEKHLYAYEGEYYCTACNNEEHNISSILNRFDLEHEFSKDSIYCSNNSISMINDKSKEEKEKERKKKEEKLQKKILTKLNKLDKKYSQKLDLIESTWNNI